LPLPDYTLNSTLVTSLPLINVCGRVARALLAIYQSHVTDVATTPLTLKANAGVYRVGGRKHTYVEGEEVHARWCGGGAFYPGHIRALNRDGTYQVSFGDGDYDERVPYSCLRPIGAVHLDANA
jgi:hypothetical protein